MWERGNTKTVALIAQQFTFIHHHYCNTQTHTLPPSYYYCNAMNHQSHTPTPLAWGNASLVSGLASVVVLAVCQTQGQLWMELWECVCVCLCVKGGDGLKPVGSWLAKESWPVTVCACMCWLRDELSLDKPSKTKPGIHSYSLSHTPSLTHSELQTLKYKNSCLCLPSECCLRYLCVSSCVCE